MPPVKDDDSGGQGAAQGRWRGSAPGPSEAQAELSARLLRRVADEAKAAGGWLPFDRYMALALYAPGLGYYARGDRVLGSQGDFVTAPELSPLFGAALARQVAQLLDAAQADQVYEFGAGSGALAAQLLDALDALAARGGLARPLATYRIVEVSGALRAQQQAALARFGGRVHWLDELPAAMHGVLLGNEVLDAMPARLLAWDGTRWRERGVSVSEPADGLPQLAWADRDTDLAPPAAGPFPPGYLTEVHPQALAFVRTLAERLQRGAVLLLDYGFPEAEYYHPQRSGGTLMCHRGQRADADPLADPGLKDITVHVDWSAVALAAQDAGLDVLGYSSQAHFLVNCGLPALLQGADARQLAGAQKLMAEHEMGELFKVLLLGRGIAVEPLGFVHGDRMHRL